MIKEFENVKIGGIDYDYISIDTKNVSVQKTYIIKNKHKYDWKFEGTDKFGDWDQFTNVQNGKEYNRKVYKNDIAKYLKEM
jgi:hypothetical protein